MDDVKDAFGTIGLPRQLRDASFKENTPTSGAENINRILDSTIGIFFAAAAISFIIMFVWGAVQIILSSGDKEAIAKARAKITWAVIGIFLLALSYLIFSLLETITGFQFFID